MCFVKDEVPGIVNSIEQKFKSLAFKLKKKSEFWCSRGSLKSNALNKLAGEKYT